MHTKKNYGCTNLSKSYSFILNVFAYPNNQENLLIRYFISFSCFSVQFISTSFNENILDSNLNEPMTLFADPRKESSLVRFDLELEQSRTSSYPLKKIAFSCFSRKFDAKSGGNAISSDFRINSMFFCDYFARKSDF